MQIGPLTGDFAVAIGVHRGSQMIDHLKILIFGAVIVLSCPLLTIADDGMPVLPENYTCDKFVLSTDVFKSATWCVSSALAPQGSNTYGPRNLARDGAWCEGKKGYGIGEIIKLRYEPYETDNGPPSYDRLIIGNGYDKSNSTFVDNSRVKQIEIKTDKERSWVRSLQDKMGEQVVLLGEEISPVSISITILSVYPGRKYQDTCISTLVADFGM